ncbi:hypothetical protein QJS66_17530 [Kocuria rhizophila]|nr:hypothetical protein QJS66_17530 [Kocuria rhizophila]
MATVYGGAAGGGTAVDTDGMRATSGDLYAWRRSAGEAAAGLTPLAVRRSCGPDRENPPATTAVMSGLLVTVCLDDAAEVALTALEARGGRAALRGGRGVVTGPSQPSSCRYPGRSGSGVPAGTWQARSRISRWPSPAPGSTAPELSGPGPLPAPVSCAVESAARHAADPRSRRGRPPGRGLEWRGRRRRGGSGARRRTARPRGVRRGCGPRRRRPQGVLMIGQQPAEHPGGAALRRGSPDDGRSPCSTSCRGRRGHLGTGGDRGRDGDGRARGGRCVCAVSRRPVG